MKNETLSVDLLRIDGGTQSRIGINDEVVADYREAIQNAGGDWPFPALDVFCDGVAYYIADGFHRWHAANQAKRASVPCNIRDGTKWDARVYGMTANDKHGLRMTRADKRHSVEWLLENGNGMLQADIAEKAGVSKRTVATIVAERKVAAAKKLSPRTGEKDANCTFSSRSGDKKRSKPATDSDPADFPDGPVDNLDEDHEPTDDEIRAANGEKPKPPAGDKKSKGKPAVSGPDCKALFKEYDRAIGPLVRLVDRIAGQVNEKNGEHHKTVHEHLNCATEEMMEWLNVSR